MNKRSLTRVSPYFDSLTLGYYFFSVAQEVKKLTIETVWPEPRHERGKWKELLEKNLLDFEPFPLEKNMVNELLSGKTLQSKVTIYYPLYPSILLHLLSQWKNVAHAYLIIEVITIVIPTKGFYIAIFVQKSKTELEVVQCLYSPRFFFLGGGGGGASSWLFCL